MHDGSDDPIINDEDIVYEDEMTDEEWDEWYAATYTSRPHNWKVRREGFRELLLSKGWILRGAYASKWIAGKEVIASGIREEHPDFYIVRFCLKSAVERPGE